jgi:hypothetical protein
VPLTVVVMVVAMVVVVGVTRLGVAAIEVARARIAADASALAAAAEGPQAGRRLAATNDADISEGLGEDQATVSIDTPVGSVEARAVRTGGSTRSNVALLAPAMRAAVGRAEQLLARQVPISSGRRTTEEQQRLWDSRKSNPYPVARPGSSRHERGLAIDVPVGFVAVLVEVASDAGLCRPLPKTDPIHFEVCGG